MPLRNSIRVAAATATISILSACAHAEAGTATQGSDVSIGRVEVTTIPFDPDLSVRSATYTPSGKVLVSYTDDDNADDRDRKLATMNDDGTGFRPFFAGRIPERPKDNGIRFMVFPDNKRIFLGDFILECTAVLEKCTDPKLLPVTYPAEIADGEHVGHRWSEMIVAPDNRSIAWTTLLSNYSALVFTGELRRADGGYVIAKPQIVSTLDPFRPDPDHPDGVLPQPVLGGEVKQFVHGGTALSLVGSVRRDIPDSVVQYLATGEREAITDTPGYTETTIFSPDERLGITMTTRFSPRSDPAILGLLPRPYPDSLNMGLSMFAYTYGVTGVRGARPGNIGPALIDIAASKSEDGYLGIDLSTDPEWVFHSPMSWHPDGTKALWPEGRREGGERRIQVVHLPDYRPAAPVAARPTPSNIPYGKTDLSVVKEFAKQSRDIDVKVYGRASGHIEYRRTPAKIVKTYVNFSDDGQSVYSGSEALQVNPQGNSTYVAKVALSGPKPGRMDLTVTFGPISGNLPARIVFDHGADGQPALRGFAEYDGRRLDVADLVP
ncbi:hypothetical protein GCM10011494_24970 [Novosphingobium endophyticum]|uniref:Uncharacterized protein n=1 Tax=Novosphingobium endophyticum TaxID=1955250 RepID=A0A916TTK5_9SPHN|nr:hypothetical protein [Novosphingobium endophyticum]GGC05411.1 hypothetical protein GCM10011494_24970 [Novosphingobium endophyticum]